MFVHITRGLLIALVVLPVCSTAEAQDASTSIPSVFGYLAFGASSLPRTAGSRVQQIIPYLGGRVQSGRRYVSLDGLDARMNVPSLSHVEFGPAFALTFGRDNGDIRTPRGSPPSIDNSFEAGAFVAVTRDDVFRLVDEAHLTLHPVRGVSGVHDGWVSTAKASYALPINQRFVLQADGSFRVVSEAFASTFFDVAPPAATASGLTPFDATGGMQQAGGSLLTCYGLTRTWSLAGFATPQRLVGDAARSPVVATGGSRNQLTAGFGLAYSC